jgi:hypothetical protein
MAKGTSTTSSTSSPSPLIAGPLSNVAERAMETGSLPYTPYGGNTVAGFTPDQLSAMENIRRSQGNYDPYLRAATSYANMGAAPASEGVAGYLNPFSDYISQALAKQHGIEQQGVTSQLIGSGAWGNDRAGLTKAALQEAQDRATGQTMAGFYNSALANVQADRARQGQAAYTMGNLANVTQNLGLTDISSLLQSGGLQQGQEQRGLDWLYQQFMQGQAFPYQQNSWLASLIGGLAPAFGGTTTGTSTPAQPSMWGQIAGAAMAAAPMILSDRRLKRDAAPVGMLFDGTPVHRFRYGGDATTHIGLMSDEVSPHARAIGPGGYEMVDYGKATDRAARSGYDVGGVVGDPSAPIWQRVRGYVPGPLQLGNTGSGLPRAMESPKSGGAGGTDAAKMGEGFGKLARGIYNQWGSHPMDISGGTFSPLGVGEIMPSFSGLPGSLGPLYRHGGAVPGYDDGGALGFNDRFSGESPSLVPQVEGLNFSDRAAGVTEGWESGAFRTPGEDEPGAGWGDRRDVWDKGYREVRPASRSLPSRSDSGDTGVVSARRPVVNDDVYASAPDDRTMMARVRDSLTGRSGTVANPAREKDSGKFGLMGLMSPEMASALIQAGGATMASGSPWAGVAIGHGLTAGAKGYEAAMSAKEKREHNQDLIDLRTEALMKQAQQTRWQYLGPDEKSPGNSLFLDTRSPQGQPNVISRPGQVGQKPGTVRGPGDTMQLVNQLLREAQEKGQPITTQEAITIVRRGSERGQDMATIRREAEALRYAKALVPNPLTSSDRARFEAELQKRRLQLGLPAIELNAPGSTAPITPTPVPTQPVRPAEPAGAPKAAPAPTPAPTPAPAPPAPTPAQSETPFASKFGAWYGRYSRERERLEREGSKPNTPAAPAPAPAQPKGPPPPKKGFLSPPDDNGDRWRYIGPDNDPAAAKSKKNWQKATQAPAASSSEDVSTETGAE